MSSSESEGSSDSLDVAMQETQASHLQRPKKRSRATMDDSSSEHNINVPKEDAMPNPFECPSKALKNYAKGPFNPKKTLLRFATKVDNNKKKNSGGSREWECHMCKKHYFGSYTRVYCHLLWIGGQGVKGCKKINDDEKLEANRLYLEGELLKSGGPIGTTPTPSFTPTLTPTSTTSKGKGKAKRDTNVADLFNIQVKEKAEESIGRFLFVHGIPFHVSHSSFYKQMCKDIYAAGPSFVPLGETKLRTTILDKEYSKSKYFDGGYETNMDE